MDELQKVRAALWCCVVRETDPGRADRLLEAYITVYEVHAEVRAEREEANAEALLWNPN